MIALVSTGGAALAVLFVLLWARQLRTRNATSVDAAWAAGIALLSATYAFFSEGEPARRALVGALGFVWGARLAAHLVQDRVLRHAEEDGRYRALRERFGERAQAFFFVFYLGQALVATLFSVPILAAMSSPSLPLGLVDAAGTAVFAVSVAGEAIADRQLARFRADPANRGKTCRAGLWRVSRHPNYFFEWVHWWAYVVIGRGDLLTFLGPVLMFLFLFRLTGIPYTEKQALKSRGDDYRRYQRTTSPFFPWFPKSEDRAR